MSGRQGKNPAQTIFFWVGLAALCGVLALASPPLGAEEASGKTQAEAAPVKVAQQSKMEVRSLDKPGSAASAAIRPIYTPPAERPVSTQPAKPASQTAAAPKPVNKQALVPPPAAKQEASPPPVKVAQQTAPAPVAPPLDPAVAELIQKLRRPTEAGGSSGGPVAAFWFVASQ